MGREARRVPANWEHPKCENGRFIPLMSGKFAEVLAEWDEGQKKWEEGFRENYGDGDKWIPRDESDDETSYEDWAGQRPVESDYMPQWSDEEKTHWQMYEDTSEGTPISPVMETPEELARWLADNKASAFADQTATYEAWLSTIKRGWACSAVYSPQTGIISGVESLKEQ